MESQRQFHIISSSQSFLVHIGAEKVWKFPSEAVMDGCHRAASSSWRRLACRHTIHSHFYLLSSINSTCAIFLGYLALQPTLFSCTFAMLVKSNDSVLVSILCIDLCFCTDNGRTLRRPSQARTFIRPKVCPVRRYKIIRRNILPFERHLKLRNASSQATFSSLWPSNPKSSRNLEKRQQ